MSITVAVVVPLSFRSELTPEEQVSFKHLVHFLGSHDKFLVAPRSLSLPPYRGFGIKRFSDKFFGSPTAYGKLVLSRQFYAAFRDYDYMLIYHLDALVFSDQLLEWCRADLDFIGAPWLKCDDSPWVEHPRVGNGGFSLRKVRSFLKVLDSKESSLKPGQYWEMVCKANPTYRRYLRLPKKYLKGLRLFNNAKWEAANCHLGEEFFWVDRGPHFYPDFKIASFDEALRFAFEVAPRLCFELNGRKLPFGCHAWQRYDRGFWEPYLLH